MPTSVGSQHTRLRLKDVEKTIIIRKAHKFLFYDKRGQELENSCVQLVEDMRILPRSLIRQCVKSMLLKQVILSQLQFDKNRSLPDSCCEAFIDMEESGNEMPVLVENGALDFSLVKQGERCFSPHLSAEKKHLLTANKLWKSKDHASVSTEKPQTATLQGTLETRDSTRQGLNERTRNGGEERNQMKKTIERGPAKHL